jgi:hypothetical protein
MEVALSEQPSLPPFGSPPRSVPPQRAMTASSQVAFLQGQIPDAVKKWPAYQKWVPLTPLHVALQVSREQRTKIQCELTPVKAGDERVLLENAKRAKQQAIQSLKAFMAEHPDQRTSTMLSRSLGGISLYRIPRPGSAGGVSRPAQTPSVGGTWTLSVEEIRAFGNLLMSLP